MTLLMCHLPRVRLHPKGAFVPGLLIWRSAMIFDACAMKHLCAYCPGLPVIPRWAKVDWRRGPCAAVAPVLGERLDCTHHRTQQDAKAHAQWRYREWAESLQRRATLRDGG